MADEIKTEQSPGQAAAPNGDVNDRLARMEQLLGAHNEYLQNQIQTQEEAEQQNAKQQDEAAKAQEMQGRRAKIVEALNGYEDQPNLQAAVNHVGGQWAEEAKKYGMADEDVDAGVMDGFEKLAMAALKSKMNPANVVYQYALKQGFKPTEAQAAAEQATENAAEMQGRDKAAGDDAGAGFVKAVQAGQRPTGGAPAGKGDTFAAAQEAKKNGDMNRYVSLMNGG